MSNTDQKKLLAKLLLSYRGNTNFWLGMATLCFSIVLLLFSVILWVGFDELTMSGNGKGKLSDAYLTIHKNISKENITEQKLQLFSTNEIKTIISHPEVLDVGIVSSAKFPIEVSFTDGDSMHFSSSLFLEAVPARFIDNKPIDWYWQYDSPEVPVIVSTEFLNLYNYGFAPNENVPQLTKGTISSLLFNLRIGTYPNDELFIARVVGFSDRISSIIVPESFIDFGNKHYSLTGETPPARLLLHVKDPSSSDLFSFLRDRNYTFTYELLRWNKLRVIVEELDKGIAVLITVLTIVVILLFYMTLNNVLAKTKNNLIKLLELGYSTKHLNMFLLKRYALILLMVGSVAGVIAIIAQVRLSKYLNTLHIDLHTFPPPIVWYALVAVIIALMIIMSRMIARTTTHKLEFDANT